jgi:hypothetical protein
VDASLVEGDAVGVYMAEVAADTELLAVNELDIEMLAEPDSDGLVA